MNSNEHFDIDAWVDFARNLCSPAQQSAMQEHMASCQACSDMAVFFAKVWQVGAGMVEDAPREWSRKAKRILTDQALKPLAQLPACDAVLAFDSFHALAPDHVRARSSSVRRVVYNAMHCSLDLSIDRMPAQHDVSIVGQITDSRNPGRAIRNTPIYLLHGNKVVATTTSNDFGEFQLACKPRRSMLISFPFDGSRIDVKLDPLFNEDSRQP